MKPIIYACCGGDGQHKVLCNRTVAMPPPSPQRAKPPNAMSDVSRCTECERKWEERPNDVCPSLTHWRAFAVWIHAGMPDQIRNARAEALEDAARLAGDRYGGREDGWSGHYVNAGIAIADAIRARLREAPQSPLTFAIENAAWLLTNPAPTATWRNQVAAWLKATDAIRSTSSAVQSLMSQEPPR